MFRIDTETTTRFSPQQSSVVRFKVFDTLTGTYTRGTFHTQEAAEQWVKNHTREFVPQTQMRGRATANLLTNTDYSGTNERVCRGES